MTAASVSRETRDRLDIYLRELRRWQRAVNLVAASTLDEAWDRHVEDCLQLMEIEPGPGSWVDLGSGGGLPGLVIAAARPAQPVTLVESDARKCAFLRHVARAMAVSVDIREGRIEAVAPMLATPRVVTARALAPLDELLAYAQPMLTEGAVGLFPKGRAHTAELTRARESWRFDVDVIASRTSDGSAILRVTTLQGRR